MPMHYIRGKIKVKGGYIPFETGFFTERLAKIYMEQMNKRGDKLKYEGTVKKK